MALLALSTALQSFEKGQHSRWAGLGSGLPDQLKMGLKRSVVGSSDVQK